MIRPSLYRRSARTSGRSRPIAVHSPVASAPGPKSPKEPRPSKRRRSAVARIFDANRGLIRPGSHASPFRDGQKGCGRRPVPISRPAAVGNRRTASEVRGRQQGFQSDRRRSAANTLALDRNTVLLRSRKVSPHALESRGKWSESARARISAGHQCAGHHQTPRSKLSGDEAARWGKAAVTNVGQARLEP